MTQRLLSYGLGVMRLMGSSRRTPGACVASPILHSRLPVPGSPVPLQRYLCKVVSAPKSLCRCPRQPTIEPSRSVGLAVGSPGESEWRILPAASKHNRRSRRPHPVRTGIAVRERSGCGSLPIRLVAFRDQVEPPRTLSNRVGGGPWNARSLVVRRVHWFGQAADGRTEALTLGGLSHVQRATSFGVGDGAGSTRCLRAFG
jgi:hypothetical protein